MDSVRIISHVFHFVPNVVVPLVWHGVLHVRLVNLMNVNVLKVMQNWMERLALMLMNVI